jgi:hypothetical protein
MKTHVIPWMSREETERLLEELKEVVATRRVKTAKEPKSFVIDIEAPSESQDASTPKTLDIGGA